MLSPFEREMARQPEALMDLARLPAPELERLRAFVRGGAVATGMGSSLYALEYLRLLLLRRGERLDVVEAAELLQARPFHQSLASRPLLLVSQSGESAEVVELSSTWTGPVALITNHPGGPASARARVELPLLAGDEAGPACITFLNSLAVAWLLAHPDAAPAADLAAIAEMVRRTLAADGSLDEAAQAVASAESRVLLGRGPSLVAARQGALTLQEAAHLWITAMGAATFRHGPMEAADSRMAAVLLIPHGPARPVQLNLAHDLAQREVRLLVVGPGLNAPHLRVDLPESPAVWSPFTETVWLQRLAVAVARREGRVPGVLAHKVTRVL